jgi:hypothetical protein
VLAVMPALVFAQWSNDPNQNTPIGAAAGEQAIPKVAVYESGTSYISWFSQEAGNYNVRLQKLDILGNKMWADEGLLVSSHPAMTWLTDWDLAVDYSGYAILVFQDVRTGDNNIYAYRISPSGEFVWGANGLALSNNADFEASPVVTVTQANNAVFAWSRESFLMMQKVSPAGQKLWGENGIQLQGPEEYTWPELIPVQEDEILMGFFKQTGPFWAPTKNVFIQRFNANGQGMWGNGQAISNNAGIPAYVKMEMISDDNNGAFITWHRDNGFVFDAYVQHIAHDGALSFPANGLVLSNNSSIHQLDPVLAYDAPTGDLYSFWREHNANQSMRGISGQRISSDGNRLWGVQGKIILPMQSGEKAGLSAALTDGEPVICYYDSPAGSMNSFVKAMRLDENGNTVWQQEQVALSLVESDKMHFDASLFVNNQLIITWADKRNDGGDIYAQNLLADGNLGPMDPFPYIYPEVLEFYTTPDFDGLDFVIRNDFPETLAIDSMTLEGCCIPDYYYCWNVYSESGMDFPKLIPPGDSVVFSVWFMSLKTNIENLYDTVFIWTGLHEFNVIIDMDPLYFPSGREDKARFLDLHAWPNPFTDQVNITFYNPEQKPFALQIIDPSGTIVYNSDNSAYRNNNEVFMWDGRTNSGVRLKQGIYFLRVLSGNYKAIPLMFMPE